MNGFRLGLFHKIPLHICKNSKIWENKQHLKILLALSISDRGNRSNPEKDALQKTTEKQLLNTTGK